MQTDDHVIHIIDDDDVEAKRKSLAFLAEGFAVRVYSSSTAYLSIAPTLGKGCLLVDIATTGMDCVSLLLALRELGVSLPSIVVTRHGDVDMAVKAMKAGALDVIEKPFEDKVLIEATRQVLKKISTINAAEGLDVIRSKIANLSNREREVLKGIVEGLQNKKIAIALNVSPRTVEVHRANVMVKMMARNLPELMKMAVSIGFGAEEAN